MTDSFPLKCRLLDKLHIWIYSSVWYLLISQGRNTVEKMLLAHRQLEQKSKLWHGFSLCRSPSCKCCPVSIYSLTNFHFVITFTSISNNFYMGFSYLSNRFLKTYTWISGVVNAEHTCCCSHKSAPVVVSALIKLWREKFRLLLKDSQPFTSFIRFKTGNI